MLEIMANGAVTLIAALFGWWLGRGSRQDRQRNKLRAELEIMERLPEGPDETGCSDALTTIWTST